ncbi:MAG: SIS domain-containing protein [Frankiaceae bacterium]|nr:SIS domain-containing protein [Frankiaceae bacterium]
MSLGTAFARDLAAQPAALDRVLGVNAAALRDARSLVAGARAVRLLGIGSSRHVAGIGAAALELAGVRADAPPAPGADVPLPVVGVGDVLVAVSQSGETPALVTAVRRAHELGCSIITVTNTGGTLARLADIALDCAAGPEQVVAATKSVTTSALLLRALAGEVDAAALTAAVAQVLAADASGLVTGAHPTHVVAGGLGAEHVAAEVALKMAETGGRLLTSEPVVEHLHGPAAVPATILALVHPSDPNATQLAGDVVRIGPDPSYQLVTPELADPALAAIVALVAGQVAALAWSRRTGVDADAARGLSKITRTA